MPNKKSLLNKLAALIIFILPIIGIIYLVITVGIPLAGVTIKLQETNLIAGETKGDTFRPLRKFSLPSPQLDNLTPGCPHGTIESSAGTISHQEITNCTILLPPDKTIESSYIKNSIIQATEDTVTLQETRLVINDTTLDNTPIIASPHSIVTINNSEIKNLNQSIRIKHATLVIEESSFKDNLTDRLFQVEGNCNFVVRNSFFEDNQGVILTAFNKKIMSHGGQIHTLMPTLTFTNNIFLNNEQTILSLDDIGLLGTKITNNSFAGGNSPYIEIMNSHNYNILIGQNYFHGQGIKIENSDKVIIWANKFENVANYSAQLINSNLIAFQYNTFANCAPAAILAENTPQIELVHNELVGTDKEVERTTN